ncbi:MULTISPECIES: winged helix-turn-helix transcriptional regulator [Dellaglioa]|uniref:MarR family transcriptional regulator n=3 Tax=Dellaglioa TaxID=2767880 RepID=A0A0R1HUQ7_9LACO|nr:MULTISPECIES: helix-turn-helix domain-containing protein [Dellaglioa]KRK46455.1 MarR family transcriptional regulator [Dellaglioa algida DSM 15638]MCZ2491085.1 helix-turn-helix transcriptional regulator [Dellaglioa carnosa]MCZ2492731.1 helix-turn-helix transcriptional regulator [Dellaglioa carnosa]MCZ2494163.1 helix-turn-helix transcriptional regulator [Dellaglioa carnosa]MDK1716717.1 helix-turn-helix transcriptional regulator [Dellaglioa algida]
MQIIQEKTNYEVCPKFEKTFSILGKKWNGLIINVLLDEGPQRFKELAQKVDKCSDRVLVERLKELEEVGLVSRSAIGETSRSSYELTEQGEDMKNMMTSVHEWSEKWYTLKDCE